MIVVHNQSPGQVWLEDTTHTPGPTWLASSLGDHCWKVESLSPDGRVLRLVRSLSGCHTHREGRELYLTGADLKSLPLRQLTVHSIKVVDARTLELRLNVEAHAAIDLETMDLAPTAAIIQIGVAIFNPEQAQLQHQQLTNVSLLDCLLHGCTLDNSTLKWWREQRSELHDGLVNGTQRLGTALGLLSETLYRYNVTHVWANGAGFDLPILRHAADRCRLAPLWHYRAERDVRTIVDLAKQRGWKQPKVEDTQEQPRHNALVDASWAARTVQEASQWLASH